MYIYIYIYYIIIYIYLYIYILVYIVSPRFEYFSTFSSGRIPQPAQRRPSGPSPVAVHKRIEEGIGFLFKRFEDVLQKYATIWKNPNDQWIGFRKRMAYIGSTCFCP